MSNNPYPYLPKALINFDHPRLAEAYASQGKELTLRGISTLFEMGHKATGLAPDALLSILGFDPKNLDRYYLQSLFSVIRTAVTLFNNSFHSINPLLARQDRKEADLIANRGEHRYAIEVFRANEDQWREPGDNFETYIGRRYRLDKQAQLRSTVESHSCDFSILSVVFDSPSKQVIPSLEIENTLSHTFSEMGNPENTFLLLFTGMQHTEMPADECFFYPSLPQ